MDKKENICLTCWCSKQCDEVNGETICLLMRMYYLSHSDKKDETDHIG